MTQDEDDLRGEDEAPQDCEAGAAVVEERPGARDGKPHEAEMPSNSEVVEAFSMQPDAMGISPDDGMPMALDMRPDLPLPPPFRVDTVVCVEDTRRYVELFRGEQALEGWSSHRSTAAGAVHRMRDDADGVDGPGEIVARSAYDKEGAQRVRMELDPARVERRWGYDLVLLTEEERAAFSAAKSKDRVFLHVRPVRPRCAHYKRQVFSNDDQADPNKAGHFVVLRVCEARRSVGGGFMSLRDEAVYACDLRSPPDAPSIEKHLDQPDRVRLTAATEMVPLFNIKEPT